MRVLAVGDLHLPFIHKDALAFLEAVRDEYSPDHVVQMGDFMDSHAISYHETDPDGMSAGQELEMMKVFARRFFELFPDGDMIEGNHTRLPFRKALSSGLPRGMIRSLEEIMGLPESSWTLHDRLTLDGVIYEHGESLSGLYAHVAHAKNNMRSTVIGHLHSLFGVQYAANDDMLIFGVAAGCLIDHKSYAMAYGKRFARKPILGVTIIDDGLQVISIPMQLSQKGDWTGKL
jgi:hypothetical protein